MLVVVELVGGLQAIADLDRMLRGDRDVKILLVSDQNYLLFTPLLPQIASSYTDPRHIVQAVREIRGRRRFRFRRDVVRAGVNFAAPPTILNAPWSLAACA